MAYMRGRYYIYEGADLTFACPDLEGTLPMKVFNELVLMQYAKLTPKQREKAEKRAIKNNSGNFSCDALREKYKLPTTLEKLNKIINT